MARISTKYVDWKIFIDGIEIPWIGFSVSVGVWNGGGASIIIEPDKYLERHLRPTSLVHIFMYDDLETSANDYDKFKLWWEGEVTGFSTSKSGTSRQLSVDCAGIISYLQKTQMYALGVGTIANSHILTGSTLIQSTGATALAVRKAIIPKELAQSEDSDKIGTLTSANKSDAVSLDFGESVLNVLAYLLSFNAVGRLQTVRRDLFGKITTIKDAALGRMVPRAVSQPFFEQALAGITAGGSLLDLIKTMSGALYYDLVSTTGPIRREAFTDRDTLIANRYHHLGKDPEEKAKNLYAIPAFNFRNDYFFTPKIYYALPPACNMIFPEYLSGISLSRTFFDDPTRVVLSTTLGAELSVVAPDSIFRFTNRKLTPGEFWSNNADGVKQGGQSESPYINSNLNLFAAVTDIEIERGILCAQMSPDFEVFSAISNLFDLRKESDRSRIESLAKGSGDIPGAVSQIEGASSKERSYIYALKAIADYQYKLTRFQRSVSIQMDGHRWLVPGLPTTIFDVDQSYIGMITSHTFAVDAEGNETSTVGLNYVRPFPEINVYLVEKLEKEQQMVMANEQNLKAIEIGAEGFKVEAKKQRAAIAKTFTDLNDKWKTMLDDLVTSDYAGNKLLMESAIKVVNRSIFVSPVRNNPAVNSLLTSAKRISNITKQDPTFSSAYKNALRINIEAMEKELADPSLEFAKNIPDAAAYLATAINQYYDSKLKETQKATLDLNSGDISFIQGLDDSVNKLSTSIYQTRFDDSEQVEDFFAPPIFANMDLIDGAKSAEIYEKLVGSKPILENGNVKKTTPTVTNLKIEAYRRFLEFADEVNKIFPVYGTEKGSTKWGQKIDQADNAESVRQWEESTYLRRSGLLSLNDFSKMYGLTIKVETSDEPTIMQFLTLIPSSHNSIFDKIVDEFEMLGRKVNITPAAGAEPVLKTKSSDPAISKLRESVNPKSTLFAGNRQAIILDYAVRHFGSRAFDGR